MSSTFLPSEFQMPSSDTPVPITTGFTESVRRLKISFVRGYRNEVTGEASTTNTAQYGADWENCTSLESDAFAVHLVVDGAVGRVPTASCPASLRDRNRTDGRKHGPRRWLWESLNGVQSRRASRDAGKNRASSWAQTDTHLSSESAPTAPCMFDSSIRLTD